MEEDTTPPAVKFRAGKMVQSGSRVTPDPRKGWIQVIKDSAVDGLNHFQWRERTTTGINKPVEDDIILLPEEASFGRCDQAGRGARVIMLKLQDSHLFFWMQEPNPANDDMWVEKVKEAIGETAPGEESAEMQAGNPHYDGSERTTYEQAPRIPQESRGMESGGVLQAEDLQAILQRAIAPRPEDGAEAMLSQFRGENFPLGNVIKAEDVSLVFREPHVVDRLAEYVPETDRNPEAMAELISSPFIKQQLDSFSMALAQGTVDFSQFSIQNAPSGTIPSVRAFLEAIVNSNATESTADNVSNNSQTDQDKPMDK